MQIIANVAAIDTALPSFAPAIKRLVMERRAQLLADFDADAELDGFATFVIVQPGDGLAAIETVVGFPIAHEYPPWEWVLDHGHLYEAPIIVSDDGTGFILIVPDEAGIDPRLLSILRAQAEQADATET